MCDRRYPWVVICEREFGRGPGQLFDERNLVAHLDEFEGDPRRRPLTVDELEAFFARQRGADRAAPGDAGARARCRRGATRRCSRSASAGACGAPSWRCSTSATFAPSHRLPEFGAYGQLHVRYGKSKRGGGPQRRTVLTVFDWAVEVVEQYVTEIRPRVRLPATIRRCS